MTEEFSGELKIANLENFKEFTDLKISTNNFKDYDLMIIDEYTEDLIKYPTFVSFKIELPADKDTFLNNLNKKDRYYLKKYYSDIKSKYKVEILENIEPSEFAPWYDGYLNFMNNKKFGVNNISDKWLNLDLPLAKAVYFYKDDVLQGGSVFKQKEDIISMSFAWYSEELRRDGGATALLHYFIDRCYANGIKEFGFGKDPNLFGGRITLGIYDFKSKWNSTIKLSRKFEIKGLIINTSKPFIFYSLDSNNNLLLNKINL